MKKFIRNFLTENITTEDVPVSPVGSVGASASQRSPLEIRTLLGDEHF